MIEKSSLIEVYDEAQKKTGDKRLAKRALARKISSISLAVMKTGNLYLENILLNNKRITIDTEKQL